MMKHSKTPSVLSSLQSCLKTSVFILLVSSPVLACGTTAVEHQPPELEADDELTQQDSEDAELSTSCENKVCAPGRVCFEGECVSMDIDHDNDGHPLATDCNDANDRVYPGARELCDGLDNDCDGRFDEDFDLDGDQVSSCGFPADCDDTREDVSPYAPELCDGVDNNCNGRIDEGFDKDGDGFSTCGEPADCDDDDEFVFPGAAELCNRKDDNCDNNSDEGGVCIGCSDGVRDELVDQEHWPEVAACAGSFGRGSLRAQRTNTACGNNLGVGCPVAEDLCAPGWHLCMRNGSGFDLRFRLTAAECNSLPATYVTGSNNCANAPDSSPRDEGCNMSEPLDCYPTGWCSAPVACGKTETSHCAHAVWPGQTRIYGLHTGRTENAGCGNFGSDVSYSNQGPLAGVLCCLD